MPYKYTIFNDRVEVELGDNSATSRPLRLLKITSGLTMMTTTWLHIQEQSAAHHPPSKGLAVL